MEDHAESSSVRHPPSSMPVRPTRYGPAPYYSLLLTQPPQNPILASTLNGAKFFCDKFVEMCGVDLTVDSPGNPFWHTGTAAPINIPGSERERRPQKAIWRVAVGLSGGKGAEGRGLRKPQAWGQFVHGRIENGISGMYSGMKFDRNTG